MTRTKAIDHIRWLSVFAHNKEDRDAIKMAINSLSAIEDIRKEIKEEADGSVGEIGDGLYYALDIIDKHLLDIIDKHLADMIGDADGTNNN